MKALLDGELDGLNKIGTINLALIPDYINRPMQMVSVNVKAAKTIYEVVEVFNNITRVHFHPETVSVYCQYSFDTITVIFFAHNTTQTNTG